MSHSQPPFERVAVIIEDDPDIRSLLTELFEQGGFETHSAANGLDGVELVRRFAPVVTTLDVSMPGIDGFEAARRIRAFSDTHLIMLTALGDEADTLTGLQSGADDYLVKPFRPRELRARVDAVLRRRERERRSDASAAVGDGVPDARANEEQTGGAGTVAQGTDPGRPTAGWLEHRGLRLHPEMHLAAVDGGELELTRSEFELLRALMAGGRRVRSKSELALALRGDEYHASDYVSDADRRAVEVHLANLRRKLGESATSPVWIETVRGVGYRLTAAG
ncbi:response regulator transcription factor [Agromyces soli]